MKFFLILGTMLMWNQAQGSALKEGVYKLAVAFAQGQDFVDYLNVGEGDDAVFTVPGNFTSRVKLLSSGDHFSFVLRAKEGQTDIVLNFKGDSLNEGAAISGQIIEPITNQIIGKFKGVKLYESKQDCGDYLIPY